MNHGSLFSGIGGFDLAAQWMGWENIFHCEWNPFGQKVLKHYWPQAISYHDITKSDFTIHRGQIDILTGGFPCQPYSAAGKRLGKEDSRHLWPEMCRAIREIQPTWVVGENVLGLVNWNGGLVFHEVQADLEAEGYEVQPYVLPAVSVNAPHRRDRVWFVAKLIDSNPNIRNREKNRFCSRRKVDLDFNEGTRPSSNTTSDRREWIGQGNEAQNGQQKSRITGIMEGRSEGFCLHGNATDTCNKGSQGRKFNRSFDQKGQKRGQQSSGSTSKFHQVSDWRDFPTQSPIRFRNDGLSSRLDTDSISEAKWRNESIKAAGNAIVPQVVLQIFKAIDEYQKLTP